MSHDNPKEINCTEALKLIAAYVDRQASEEDSRDLLKHLESCHHCLDRVEFEKLLKNRLQGLKIDTTGESLSPRIKEFLKDL